ncbi:TetR family transcriptional regulator [Clostridium carboxidivorans P7]|uniref:Transcriptional regulator, TetR family n=1 Tax=Clostridium carboxidivorans P7 TaxID=536227 RepID=C6PTF9_9CLOT|nr:TetR/AcrR family transcriptional regulator [Clostridium carboxidivorans]AKN33734.1 TetR family transcriptional regulator [Clostridium carboxidivorans P7]EET87482.1 transcriptional regulator, TetR family [Clostridium carboxidivorans P7]EFG86667.1 transcriptional regulator, TetR family [Clostridium carboxidivorans P7]
MKDTSSSKSSLKRKNILEAAAKVFSEKGYIEASIKNITDEANVAVGTFYNYFNDKEEVLEQIYEEISNMSLKAASEVSMNKDDSISQKFTLAMAYVISIYAKNKNLSKILLVKSMGINEAFEKKRWEILDRTNVYLRQILEHLKKQHSLNIQDVNVTSVLLTQSIFGVITYWLNEKLTSDLKDIIFSLCTYHLKALNIDFTYEEINKCINEIEI